MHTDIIQLSWRYEFSFSLPIVTLNMLYFLKMQYAYFYKKKYI